MIKLQIVDGSLQVSNNDNVILVAPKNSCAIDVLSLYDAIPLAVIYNKYLGYSTIIFSQPLANCIDSTGNPFDVNSFIGFAEANLGFDTYGGGCGGGGCNTSPFKYNTNLTGIEPILGGNNSSGTFSIIGGGSTNTASGYDSTISGGINNTASGNQSSIGGGQNNNASAPNSFVGGGQYNTASAYNSFVGGGFCNTSNNSYSTIGGGRENNASGNESTISGGGSNIASNFNSFVGGGQKNTASGCCSTIAGGYCNITSGDCSAILGGKNNSTNTCTSAMIIGSNITANRSCTTFVNDLTITSASACSGCSVGISTNGLLVPITTPSLTGFVPYTGANQSVNLGANNISANNFFDGFTSVVASATLITLTINSTPSYLVTGSGGQTIKMPVATTLPNGALYYFNNNQSSGVILVNNNSNTLIKSVPSGALMLLELTDNSTSAGSWDAHFQAPSNVSWSTNTLDYAGSITSATWNGNVVAINRGGTGSSTQNFVDLTTNQTIAGAKTLSTAPILSSLTASQILALDSSKNIQSLDVTTYPSLTELSYVKGVTSAIQTQLNGKQNSLGYLPVKSIVKSTYALMIADGTPIVDTIYTVTIDESKGNFRSIYFWKTNGNREWMASTPDN